MYGEGIKGLFRSLVEVVVDGTWPDSEVIIWCLRRVESRQRRVPCEARLADVGADLRGSLSSRSGFACAELVDRCTALRRMKLEERIRMRAKQSDSDTSWLRYL